MCSASLVNSAEVFLVRPSAELVALAVAQGNAFAAGMLGRWWSNMLGRALVGEVAQANASMTMPEKLYEELREGSAQNVQALARLDPRAQHKSWFVSRPHRHG